MVRAVFFDLDDTLVFTSDHDTRAYEAVAALFGAAGEDNDAILQGSSVNTADLVAEYKALLKATPWDTAYPNETCDVFSHRAGLWAQAITKQQKKDGCCSRLDDTAIFEMGKACQTCFDKTRMEEFPFVEGAVDMVRKLQQANLRTVVITNGHHVVQHEKLKACDATSVFQASDIIVGGDEVVAGRKEKPDKGIFEKACSIAGVDPSDAIHVGDSLSADVQGAINSNLKGSVWVNRHGKARKDGDPEPTATVANVTELAGVLASVFDVRL